MRKVAILMAVLLLVAFSFATLALQNGYDLFFRKRWLKNGLKGISRKPSLCTKK